jgi:hypothetical protein
MFGKNPHLNQLQSRKQLLIAESELNRSQMTGELSAFAEDMRALTERAKSFGTIASSAALLVAGVAAFKRNQTAGGCGKPSWWQTIIKGAGLASSLWMAFRSKQRDRDHT